MEIEEKFFEYVIDYLYIIFGFFVYDENNLVILFVSKFFFIDFNDKVLNKVKIVI